VKSTVLIEGNVVLRPITPADRHLLGKWQNDSEIMTGWGLPQPLRPHNAFDQQIAGNYAIFERSGVLMIEGDGTPVGRIDFDKLDMRHRSAELAIYVGETTAQGKGYAGNAIKAISKYLVRQRHVHRIELNVLEWNTRAHDLYLRLGFRDEGLLRDHLRFDGIWQNEFQMALLATDPVPWLQEDLPPAYQR
jgi:RimJ/RimL family protein N-acetyltransferase